jgi:hypothetical protein
MARGGGGGRIWPHERETNDYVAILGADLKIQAAHSQGVRNTEQRGLVLRTKQNCRNQIKEMYIFFSLHYNNYYSIGIQKLSEADRANQDFFRYKNTHDLIYTGINVQMVKAFLANKKQKAMARLPATSNFTSITMLFYGIPSRRSSYYRESST